MGAIVVLFALALAIISRSGSKSGLGRYVFQSALQHADDDAQTGDHDEFDDGGAGEARPHGP